MLRKTLMVIGTLCLLGALGLIASGQLGGLQLLLLGVVLLAGLAFETWRYKRVQPGRIEAHWQDTGERFVDPETGQTTAVYFDPRTAERHYIAVDPARPS
ncbi:hypothetical protein [Oleiagrimonas sp.]|jgi:hypothetical protein|uniref:hypothetical protein n=1 Tax=Oleiagrimonas sp. TaxID=2010330 RepID=UPI00260EF46F|nr:hypothetical protein [Oleiagrimonas sp.]MDA3913094.1 hypothetical protein [Oleiagrimonas sp.]